MAAAGTIRLTATAFTHRGAVRPGNEDAIAVGDWLSAGGSMAEPAVVERALSRGAAPVACLVADGLGGHAAGDVASRHAALRLAARVAAGAADDGDVLAALLREVDAELDGLARARPELAGMGTTVAGLLVRPDGRALVFNVGDSRVYRIEGGEEGDGAGLLVQLSTDDTPGPKLPDGRTAVLTTPQITQSLGGGAHAPGGIVPHVLEERVGEGGARYLICSDGVTDLVGRDEMADLLRAAGGDDRAAALALFEAAMARGGRDNVSIVLARVRRGG
jgi:PPM family protein phosphatase